MNSKQEIASYLILLCGLICIGLLPMGSDNIEKTWYCKIDSISTTQKNEFIPENTNKCWTNCGIIIHTKKDVKVGDSIQIKTIIIE